MTCAQCGVAIESRRGGGIPKKYCGRVCGMGAMRARRRLDLDYPARHREQEAARYHRNPALFAAYHRERLYGVKPEEYNRMMNEQDGRCAICHQPETMLFRGRVKTLSIDHDHVSKGVRGLLCSNCNNLLGRAKDDPAVLASAIEYLNRG